MSLSVAAALGIGAGISALTSAGSAIGGAVKNKKSYKYTKKLAEYQAELNKDQTTWNNLNSAAQQKAGLQAAGISAAAMGEGSFSPASMNSQNVQVPELENVGADASQSAANTFANISNMVASTQQATAAAEGQEIDNVYKDLMYGTELAQRGLQYKMDEFNLEKAKRFVDREYELIGANLKNTLANTKLTEEQTAKVIQDTEYVKQSITSIKIENKYKDTMTSRECDKLGAELAGLLKDNRVKEAQARLADVGIIYNADGLTNIVGLLMRGRGDEVMKAISETLTGMFAQLPKAMGEIFTSMVKSMGEMAGKAFDKAKDAITPDWWPWKGE